MIMQAMVTTTAIDVLGLTADGLAAAAELALPSGAGVARDLYLRLFKTGRFAPEALALAPASLAAWRERFAAAPLAVKTVVEEPTPAGVTAKAVFTTHDGYEIEAVRIPMHADDQTICISSQVGCKMGCAFCETGRMGLIRHLTAAEIVAQVFTARFVLGWNPRNIVFMGMGEALDNADNVIQALHVLTDKRGFHYSHERLTVCTAGHAEGIGRLAALGWKRLNLSISLNAPDDERRDRLMPVNRKTPLAELQRLLAAYPQRRNFVLGVNYCLMPGLNDGRADAAGIAAFCRPLGRVLVNLIPYNPGNAPLTRAPSEEEIVRFVGWLREEGLAVRRRMTKGRSIMAACGQLGNAELRRRPRPAPATAVTA
jgi:23S rRNA (adenine2503-C2)-methyltransferase